MESLETLKVPLFNNVVTRKYDACPVFFGVLYNISQFLLLPLRVCPENSVRLGLCHVGFEPHTDRKKSGNIEISMNIYSWGGV